MATKIRRCLYIGLGGTGMNSLLHAKKMFVDTYGEVPPMIGFLGIDTDGGEYKKSIISTNGQEVYLKPNEQFPIIVEHPKDIYMRNRDMFSWVPEQNEYALTGMTKGAGAIRTNGRFALTVNEANVSNKLKEAIDAITNANIANNAKYELLEKNVEIHIVFSICGGTGSGTFLNMAYLCRECKKDAKIVGYAVLADVFESFLKAGVSKVKPNAYGSIMDLDFMMHLKPTDDNNIVFKYFGHQYKADDRPFDAVFLVDNKNSNGDTYVHVDQMAEMISLALVTSSGELSSAAASTIDNIEKNILEKTMDVEKKRAWVSGLGVSEIIFSGEELAHIYALKAAKRYISDLKGGRVDAEGEASSWIDSPEVNIRENNNFDNVIDYMLNKNPKAPMEEINDKDNAKGECDVYIANNILEPDLNNRILQKIDTVNKNLHNFIVKHVNESGISGAKEVLKAIKEQVDIFMDEMKTELDDFQKKEKSLEVQLQTAIEDLTNESGKIVNLFRKSVVKEAEEGVCTCTKNLVIKKREIMRRNAAITFYNALLAQINDENKTLDNLQNVADSVSDSLGKEIAEAQNNVGQRSLTFQIDLGSAKAATINVNDNDVMVNLFVESLTTPNKLYDYSGLSPEDLRAALLNYTSSLNGTKALKDTTIDKVLDGMDDATFERIMRLALDKSKVLLKVDYQGFRPKENPADLYFIGVADKSLSRLNKDKALENCMDASDKGNVSFANIGMNDKVIFYHQYGVVPAYAVASVPKYHDKYVEMSKTVDCHFDYQVETLMQRQEFDIMPKETVDDSIDFWVLGFVFGFIKNDNGMYKVINEDEGDALDDFWLELGNYRDEAFLKFRSNLTYYHESFSNKVEEFQTTKGRDALMEILRDAADPKNYREKYSQIGLSNDRLKEKGYESIANLLREEIKVVKRIYENRKK